MTNKCRHLLRMIRNNENFSGNAIVQCEGCLNIYLIWSMIKRLFIVLAAFAGFLVSVGANTIGIGPLVWFIAWVCVIFFVFTVFDEMEARK